MPRPTAERPPKGLNSYWSHVWDHALKVLKTQGTWTWEQKPLLDEYVHALIAAEQARVGFGWLEALESYADANAGDMPEIAWITLKTIAGSLPTQWDRHTKRAAALADKLVLTHDSKRRNGIFDDEGDEAAPADAFSALDDELAPRRGKRSA